MFVKQLHVLYNSQMVLTVPGLIFHHTDVTKDRENLSLLQIETFTCSKCFLRRSLSETLRTEPRGWEAVP